MKRYYISANNQKGFEELTEAEFLSIMGDEIHRPYAKKVYREEMKLEEVPEQYRITVQRLVDARVERWGFHREKSMIEGVI